MNYSQNDNIINETIKLKKTLNVSIHKRHIHEISKILKDWDDEGLVVSTEVCESILFKTIMKENPYLHTLYSTVKLIESNMKNKDLYNIDYNKAFTLALKNTLSLNINTNELKDFLENENYFMKFEEHEKIQKKSEDAIQPLIYKSTDTKNNHNTHELAVDKNSDEHIEKKSIPEINPYLESNIQDKEANQIITWNIPKEPSINSKDIDLNSKFEAFQYSSF